MTLSLLHGQAMWMRSFYGFGPEEDGYIGWTKKAGRDRMLDLIQDGDIFIIYGAGTKETAKALRSYVLGFVQVDASPIFDYEKSSSHSLNRKINKGWGSKWTFGLPIRRAWRCDEKRMIRTIAFDTYRPSAGQALGVWGAKLTDNEVVEALKIKVTEVNVFGEPIIKEDNLKKKPFELQFKPSQAFQGSFGTHTVTRNDGVTYLYLAHFEGDGHALLGRPLSFGSKAMAMKIGVSSDIDERLNQLNAGIPPAAGGRWKLRMKAVCEDRRSAEILEQAFKDGSIPKLESLGGEFFWGMPTDAMLVFSKLPGIARFNFV